MMCPSELLVEVEGVDYPASRTGGPLLPAFKIEKMSWDTITEISPRCREWTEMKEEGILLMKIKRTILMIGLFASAGLACATEVFVSPQGNDRNPGAKEQPVASLGRARDVVRPMAGKKPTILALSGLEIPARMKGCELAGLLDGTQDLSKWRDTVLIENMFLQEVHSAGVKKHPDIPGLNDEIIAGNRSYRSQGVRTERYKYFRYHEHDPVIEELYDLKTDPTEQNNLISNPECVATLSTLRKQTEDLLTQATAIH